MFFRVAISLPLGSNHEDKVKQNGILRLFADQKIVDLSFQRRKHQSYAELFNPNPLPTAKRSYKVVRSN
jgi:hypothetical protein